MVFLIMPIEAEKMKVPTVETDPQYRELYSREPPAHIIWASRQECLSQLSTEFRKRLEPQLCQGCYCSFRGRLCEHFPDFCPTCYRHYRFLAKQAQENVDNEERSVSEGSDPDEQSSSSGQDEEEERVVLEVYGSTYCPACYLSCQTPWSDEDKLELERYYETDNRVMRGKNYENFRWGHFVAHYHDLCQNKLTPDVMNIEDIFLDGLYRFGMISAQKGLDLVFIRKNFDEKQYDSYLRGWKTGAYDLLQLKYTALLSQVKEKDKGSVETSTLHYQSPQLN